MNMIKKWKHKKRMAYVSDCIRRNKISVRALFGTYLQVIERGPVPPDEFFRRLENNATEEWRVKNHRQLNSIRQRFMYEMKRLEEEGRKIMTGREFYDRKY